MKRTRTYKTKKCNFTGIIDKIREHELIKEERINEIEAMRQRYDARKEIISKIEENRAERDNLYQQLKNL